MGKQHNKIIKRRRRKNYLKRKAEIAKQSSPQAKPEKVEKAAPAKKTAKKVAKKQDSE